MCPLVLLQSFLVDPERLAEELQRKFASSSTVQEVAGELPPNFLYPAESSSDKRLLAVPSSSPFPSCGRPSKNHKYRTRGQILRPLPFIARVSKRNVSL